MENEVEGGIWPTQKFWRSAPYARPLAGFIPAAKRNGKGEEGQEGGKVEGKLKQGRRLAKAGPAVVLVIHYEI